MQASYTYLEVQGSYNQAITVLLTIVYTGQLYLKGLEVWFISAVVTWL